MKIIWGIADDILNLDDSAAAVKAAAAPHQTTAS